MSGSAQVDWHPGAPQFQEAYQWLATFSPNNISLFTAPANGVITAVIGTAETVETGAATVTLVKSAPGVSIANGTAVCAAMNVGVTATTLQPQFLTQWGQVENLTVTPGTRLGFTVTGTITASSGNITVYWRAI